MHVWRRLGLICVVMLSAGNLAQAASLDEGAKVDLAQSEGRYRAAEAVLPQHIAELISDIAVRPIWETDGSRFVYERKAGKLVEYRLVDPRSRKVLPLLSQKQLDILNGKGQKAAQAKLSDIRWKKQGLLSFKADGQHWEFDIDRGTMSRVAERPEFESESPDGRWRAFVEDHNLFLRSVVDGRIIQLSFDGTPERSYARPVVNPKRMIAQQTMTPRIAPDVEWAPDSTKLVTYRLDYGEARTLSMMQSTPPEDAAPRSFVYHYSLPGDPQPPMATTLIFDVSSGKMMAASAAAQPILYYGGPEYIWTGDSRYILTRRPERGYRRLSALRIDAETGETTTLVENQSATYVDYYGHFWGYEKRANALFWLDDVEGFAHFSAVDPASRERRQLTNGPWRARSLAGMSADGKYALVTGSGREAAQDPYLRNLYSVDMESGKIRHLTREPLDHDISVSPDGRYFVDNMSLINEPTRSVVRSVQDGRILFEISRADPTAYLAAGFHFPEPFQAVAVDGKTALYGAIFKPRAFDPSLRYPIIENVYTGPHYVMTPKSFEAALSGRNVNSMAQLGAIGLTVDGRGTWGRSRAFHEQAYGRLHAIGVDDHVAALQQLGRRFRWFDSSRVGIYGFSAGGYDVVRMMTERPDVYSVGVSASGNHDNRLDKAVWNEQWLGLDTGKPYLDNSNVTFADKLEGNLFLAHGELDENVPVSATLRLVDRLIGLNKDFEFLIIPNADHYLDDSPYFHRKRFDFFTEKLIRAPVPDTFKMRDF